jgi:HrpA-like RNA helicase
MPKKGGVNRERDRGAAASQRRGGRAATELRLARPQRELLEQLLGRLPPVATPPPVAPNGGNKICKKMPPTPAGVGGGTVAAADASQPEPQPPLLPPSAELNTALAAGFAAQQQGACWAKMFAARTKLPALAARDMLLATVREHDVAVVAGGTGCGKSTQVPQFLLDEMLAASRGAGCHVICTQPRRIAATAVAERIAEERGETVGARGGVVGYSIRGETKRCAETRLRFCTTGVLLKMLESDCELRRAGEGGAPVSHVVVDEGHERRYHLDWPFAPPPPACTHAPRCTHVHLRSCDADLLLVAIRKLLATQRRRDRRPRVKLVLMSATLDTAVFAEYFGSAGLTVGVAQIEGRTFPVERLYLSDAIEHCGYECRSGSQYGRPEVTHAMLANEAGTGVTVADAEEDEATSEAGEVTRASMTAGQAMVAANRAARLQKEKNVMANSASGTGRLGGLAHAWCDSVGQSGMAHAKGAALGGCSRSTLDTLRMLDHGLCAVNHELLIRLVRHVASQSQPQSDEGGAVLIFLPGAGEIGGLLRAMQEDAELGRADRFWLLPLHSELRTAEQQLVFRRAPAGVRKVVLATNIAEASVTIDDISYVIDGGTHKEMQYDAFNSMAALVQTRISRANAAQRAGRAGRVRAGVCYHLFLRWEENRMLAQQLPELQRSPLERICLQIKQLGLGPSVLHGGPRLGCSQAAPRQDPSARRLRKRRRRRCRTRSTTCSACWPASR